MKQVVQSLSSGNTAVMEVPMPTITAGQILIRSSRSLISAGTERMLVDFGRAGWVEKARQQPEKVREAITKAKSDGLLTTIDAVRSKLDQPQALGYSNVGRVIERGAGVQGYSVGDRVVSNGWHAEIVAAVQNLCARIPENVSDDEAAFTVLGSIALQGMRLASPTLGERFAVMGLGLIGLVTVQLLAASGCKVLGTDPDPNKRDLARRFGAEVVALDRGEDILEVAEAFSQGRGIDGVIITAATESNEPMSQAARMSRQRGRIILVGVAGLELNRTEFYRKELSFQVSCSYGPGRYDPNYEEKGNDYPIGFVRWTEQRNFEAVLGMLASGRLDVRSLITHRFDFAAAARAYDLLASRSEPYLGILLEYGDVEHEPPTSTRTIHLRPAAAVPISGDRAPSIGFIGAGNYAGRVLIPAFASAGARLQAIASARGMTAAHFGRKFGFSRASSDTDELLRASDVDAVIIATRHDSHAALVLKALQAGKHVFVEKPLAIHREEVEAITDRLAGLSASNQRPQLMIGFNRRFAPHTVRMKALLAAVREPKSVVITVNAGKIPADHWTQSAQAGGGRIIGEACHFVDLARFLVGQRIVGARIQVLGGSTAATRDDKAAITLTFEDGSWAVIHYLANGHRSYPKERVEVFCAGRILLLDNFRRLTGYGWRGFRRLNLWRQDKGQKACASAFLSAIKSKNPAPIPAEEILEVARVSIQLGEDARA